MSLSSPNATFPFADGLIHVVVALRPSGEAFYVNTRWKKETGLSAEQSAGHGWQLAVNPDALDQLMASLHRVEQSNSPVSVSIELRSSEGTYRTYDGAIFPSGDSGDRTLLAVFTQRDLDYLYDERFRELTDQLPVFVWATDDRWRMTFCNRAWTEYTGLGLGSSGEERAALIHPDDSSHVIAARARGASEVRCRLRRAGTDTYRWFLLRYVVLENAPSSIFARVGTGIDIHEHLIASEERETQMRSIAEALPDIVWSTRSDGVQDYVNSAMVRYTGLSLEALSHTGWRRALHPEDEFGAIAAWQRSFETGKPYEYKFRLRRADGRYRWFLTRGVPLRAPDESIVRWFGTCTDIDDQIRITSEQAYLAQLGEIINNSLNLQTTLTSISDSAVPALADVCRIEVVRGDTITDAVTYRSDELRDRFERGEDHSESLLFPLVAGPGQLGTIRFARADRWGGDPRASIPFLEEVARRAALAIRNAIAYEHERNVADAMQAASLPQALPVVAGVAFDAVYIPGKSEAQIGGDWYDAFALNDGRIVLSIGDVAGSGLQAAVTMSNMRQIIRGTAQVHADPVLMINAADRALRLEEPERFVTAFVGVLDRVTRTMTFASAGHPPPLVRHQDGSLLELEFIDLPLGLRDQYSDTIHEARSTTLRLGDTIVLYTDGLIESGKELVAGVKLLHEALGAEDMRSEPHPARRLLAELLPIGAHDDVAILAVTVTDHDGTEDVVRWQYDDIDAEAMYVTRSQLRSALEARNFDERHVRGAELVLGELMGNVVRHAPGPVEIILDATGRHVVLHVIDEGPGFERHPMLPVDVLSESGRGLYIIDQFAREFSATRRAPRGSHARAVLMK